MKEARNVRSCKLQAASRKPQAASILLRVIFAAALVLVPQIAPAHEFRADDPTPMGMLNEAGIVARGVVKSVDWEYVENSQGIRTPYSIVTLAVAHAYRGTNEGVDLVFYTGGGRLENGRNFFISGQPDYHAGEEVIVFLNPRKYPLWATVHGDAGVFRVANGAGKTIVFDHDWRAITAFDSAKRKSQKQIHCWTEKTDKRSCVKWASEWGTYSTENDAVRTEAMVLDAFELTIDEMISVSNESPENVEITKDKFLDEYKAFLQP
ncbi:hypothetical protein K8I61_02150 [bacterium]|nr:hypothetical protein [bacterium]